MDTQRQGSRRWRRSATWAVGLVLAGTLAPGVASAQEQPAAGFLARAVAQGGRLTFGAPGFLIVEDYVDGGGPVASAVLDSTGSSKAFGSLPYPGELGIAGPGLAAGVAAGFGVDGAKLPDWPFYAGAEHPVTPESEVADPSGQYALQAAADADGATGSARSYFGNEQGSGGGRSEASVTVADDGTVTAVAQTVDEMLSLGGGALLINSVQSRSVTTRRPGAEPVTETSLTVSGISVNGEGVVFHAGDAEGASPLTDALAEAGIELELAEGRPVPGGGSADALRFTVTGGLPVGGTPQGRVVLSLGGATTSVLTGDASVGENSGGEGAAPADPAVRTEPGVATPPALNTGGMENPEMAPPVARDLDSVAAGGGSAALSPAEPAVPLAARPIAERKALGNGVGALFGFVVAGGVALLAGAYWWRKKGVRSPWTF